jgi:putative transposase
VDKAIGINVGLAYSAITNDGFKFDHPRCLIKHQHDLKRKQQELSKKKSSQNVKTKIGSDKSSL